MNSLLPMLLMGDSESSSDSNLKTLLMMQTMSQGNTGLDMNTMLPILLMNLMMGGMDSETGFANNFNMMLPMLMMNDEEDSEEDSDDDSGFDMSMLVLLTAMQSQAPGSAMGANAMMPLLMMA